MARALDLGIFLPNAKGGAIMADASPPQYMPSWELNRLNSVIAEAAGFDFLLSMVKWRGLRGTPHHWDYSPPSFTFMAAVGAAAGGVPRSASLALPTTHPPPTAPIGGP